jgi:hypothetical protein
VRWFMVNVVFKSEGLFPPFLKGGQGGFGPTPYKSP